MWFAKGVLNRPDFHGDVAGHPIFSWDVFRRLGELFTNGKIWEHVLTIFRRLVVEWTCSHLPYFVIIYWVDTENVLMLIPTASPRCDPSTYLGR